MQIIIPLSESQTAESQTIPAVKQTQFLPMPDDLRDFRYCEIVPVFRKGLKLHVEVYNTINLNDCPAELWDPLDVKALANTYDAQVVKKNGPRHWVINGMTGGGDTATGKVVNFGGIEMKLVAALDSKRWQGSVGDKPYKENEVQRTTIFIYNQDNKVYELTSAKGDVYRMQAYSQHVDPNQSIADLDTLGERLNLPTGWSFKARTLPGQSTLTENGRAIVIVDQLENTYQKLNSGEQ